MKYNTRNELKNFRFDEAHVSFIEVMPDSFNLVLDNVFILPDNSCNRDIREMRTNNMEFTITNAKVVSIIEEGYKIYNADGKLLEDNEDRVLDKSEYNDLIEALDDSMMFSIIKKDNYEFVIDTDEHTYFITVSGDEDTQSWDRFMNVE